MKSEKKIIKQILSVVLSITLFCSVFSGIPMKAEAETESGTDTVQQLKITNANSNIKGNWAEGAGHGVVNVYDGARDGKQFQSAKHTEPTLSEDADDAYVEVTLSNLAVVSGVDLYALLGGIGFPTKFTILAYVGTQWTEVATGTAADLESYTAGKTSVAKYTFEEVRCNRLRIVTRTLGNHDGGYYFELREVEVYGKPIVDTYVEIEKALNGTVVVGKTLVSEDFSGMKSGSAELPTGWEQITGKAWNDNAATVTLKKEDTGMVITGKGGQGVLGLPILGTSDYVITADITCGAEGGEIGFKSNIDPTGATKTATISCVGMKNDGSYPAKIMFENATVDKDNIAVDATELGIVTDASELTTGLNLTLTMCSVQGTSYFYVNGIYAGAFKEAAQYTGASRCALYAITSIMIVRNVTVQKLTIDQHTYAEVEKWVGDITLGRTALVSEDFSDIATGSADLPTGWEKITGKWWDTANARVGKVDGGMKLDSTKVTIDETTIGASDGVLALPNFGTSDYVMTAEITCASDGGYLGFLSNIDATGTLSDALATVTGMKNDKDNHRKGFFYNKGVAKGNEKEKREDLVTLGILEATDIIKSGTELTLTICSVKGITYFYINGSYVGWYNKTSPRTEESRCALYSCASSMIIKDVTAYALIVEERDISKELYGAETLLYEDFSSMTSSDDLPKGWNLCDGTEGNYISNWIWNPQNGSVELDSEGVVLKGTSGTGVLVAPSFKLDELDYMVTAELEIRGQGNIGLVTNITDPLSDSMIVTNSYMDIADGNIYQYNRDRGKYYPQVAESMTSALGKTIKQGGEVKLTAYCYDGVTYFYVDDIFVHAIRQESPKENGGLCAVFATASTVLIKSVKIQTLEERGTTSSLQMTGAALRYATPDGKSNEQNKGGMRFTATMDKGNEIYKACWDKKNYTIDDSADVQLGMLIAPKSDEALTIDTADALNVTTVDIESQDDNTITYSVSLLDDVDNEYMARGYMKVKTGSGYEYYYSNQINRSQARLATRYYPEAEDEIKDKLNAVYTGNENYKTETDTLKFTMFSDFHYTEGRYATTIEHLETIMQRAKDNGSAFVMQGGDFCNDFANSPEFSKAWLNNNYSLSVYGIYGNHETEGVANEDNTMAVVTPTLTNDKKVVWGSSNGTLEQAIAEDISYYYFEKNGFRIVCTDSNYSYNPVTNTWEHTKTGKCLPPEGNLYTCSFGPTQLEWVEEVLMDAAESLIPCIVVSHASVSGKHVPSADSDAMQKIYAKVNAKENGTVLMSINGHAHTNNIEVIDNVLYRTCNTVLNGWYKNGGASPYQDQAFTYVKYDEKGDPVDTVETKLSELTGIKYYIFDKPLSANVEISTAGYIKIKGTKANWAYGIVPEEARCNEVPEISDYEMDYTFY